MAEASAQAQARAQFAAALGLMTASGFAALGLQIVWTRQSGAFLGHEAAGVLGVVTAFFGGLALGALAMGPAIQRSARPLRWYAGCEAVVAAWTLVLGAVLVPASGLLTALAGPEPSPAFQWGVAFVGTGLLLLPATAAMGATLPAMERLLAGQGRQPQAVAALYAANTFGAVMGVMAAAFWLVPAWGLTPTAFLCAGLTLGCAGGAWWVFGSPAQRHDDGAAVADRPAGIAPSERRLVLLLAATGLLGIGYEVLMVRALSQVAENTVYTFALLLAVYLVGTALGAAGLHRWLRRHHGDNQGENHGDCVRDRLIVLLALSCLLGTASLWVLRPLAGAVAGVLAALLGPGMGTALATEAVLALLAFGPATLVMGALFSLLARSAAASAGLGLGRALGVNTLGGALAPPLAGVLLLPAIGLKFALLAIAAGYLALLSRAALRRPGAWAVGAAALALALLAPPLVTVDVPSGGRLVSHREGALATVSVVEDAEGTQWLHIDNRQPEGSDATAAADGRQALLPLLWQPAPRRALFLGLGTGTTVAAALEDPALRVDAVELLPEVVAAAALFTPAVAGTTRDPRLAVHVADARRFVRAGGPAYDLVVSDNFHPARSGSAALYTAEHFTAVQARLAPQGAFCQWLPLHQMDLATLQSIVRTFTAVYPQAFAVLATNSLDTPVLGLVARRDGGRIDPAAVRQRLAGGLGTRDPAEWGLDDEWAVLGSVVAGPAALRRWSAGAPLNTDDHPVVAYLAPRATYASVSRPRERLLQWLAELSVEPGEVFDGAAEPAAEPRLRAYRAARLHYLEAGRGVRPADDVRQMLQQVQAPLLETLRLSPDFRPAYEPLLRMAQALGATDPSAAAALLGELHRLQPAWPQAQQALAALQAGSAPP